MSGVPPDEDDHYRIFSSDGTVFRIDPSMVARDFSEAIHFDFVEWEKITDKRTRFRAADILDKRPISPRDVIVLQYTDDGQTYTSWFVRCAFQIKNLRKWVGEKFLWQMPHSSAMGLVVALQQHYRNMLTNGPSDVLVKEFWPSSRVFKPENFEGTLTTRLNRQHQWMHHLAILSMVPDPSPTTFNFQNANPRKATTFARNLKLRPEFKFSELNGDIQDMILTITTQNLIDSQRTQDLKSLLQLRMVNKQFKAAVDQHTVTWTSKLYQRLNTCISSGEVLQLQRTGTLLADCGLSVSNVYSSWLLRKWAERDKKIPMPITFSTFLGWKGIKHRSKSFDGKVLKLQPPPDATDTENHYIVSGAS